MATVYVDIPKLRGKMAERGYTISSMADVLGVNRNTFSTYLANPGKMPYQIISCLANTLCDTQDEATSIFFARDFRSA